MKHLLTIAGSDSSGGAGIQADLKTFSALGTFGMSVITAVTAQNTMGVFAVQNISKVVVQGQIEAVFSDIQVDGVKIGMVSEIEIIETIAEGLKKYSPDKIVLDPVMISKSGYDLLNPDAKDCLKKKLLPLSTIVTPNLPEAEAILGKSIKTIDDMKESAKEILDMGPKAVLVKGGHLEDSATDLLYDGKEFILFEAERINTKNTHGTGCTLSSAICANLANGMDVKDAVKEAKDYITTAIIHSITLGHGVGPTNHFYTLYRKAGYDCE